MERLITLNAKYKKIRRALTHLQTASLELDCSLLMDVQGIDREIEIVKRELDTIAVEIDRVQAELDIIRANCEHRKGKWTGRHEHTHYEWTSNGHNCDYYTCRLCGHEIKK